MKRRKRRIHTSSMIAGYCPRKDYVRRNVHGIIGPVNKRQPRVVNKCVVDRMLEDYGNQSSFHDNLTVRVSLQLIIYKRFHTAERLVTGSMMVICNKCLRSQSAFSVFM